jgi:muramoyltetrapeptide carboxypeptidase LdcA involved in peptidoglycan recycling
MFADLEVAAILPIRGGWGCSRMLPYSDYVRIRQNPKIIIDFSDIKSWSRAMIGHVEPILTRLIGLDVEISRVDTIRMPEPAVI